MTTDTSTQPTEAQLKLAAQANVKWRKWQSASDKVFGSFNDPDLIAKSVARLNELGAFMRKHELWDFNDNEFFGIELEDGSTLRFRWARKGDPRFCGVDPA